MPPGSIPLIIVIQRIQQADALDRPPFAIVIMPANNLVLVCSGLLLHRLIKNQIAFLLLDLPHD
jgi:hypothetical protein